MDGCGQRHEAVSQYLKHWLEPCLQAEQKTATQLTWYSEKPADERVNRLSTSNSIANMAANGGMIVSVG
jgi:hypothetical protein